MAILLARKAVYDFIECAVAAAGDYELAAFVSGTQCNFRRVARPGGFCKLGFDAALCQNLASLV